MQLDGFESFLNGLDTNKLNVDNIVVLQHDRLKWSFYAKKNERLLQHSVSKSFVAMAAGFAIDEQKISLDARVTDFFSCDLSDPRLTRLTLRHLLTMSSGHAEALLTYGNRDQLSEKDWVKYYLSVPLRYEPGTRFCYSSGDTYMASSMIQQAVGLTVKDYLIPRLFDRLDIGDVKWDTCPLGRTLACSGLYLTTDELARYGQFLLQQGRWNGRQILNSSWIAEATGKVIESTGPQDWAMGYGYCFWRCTHGAYRADGMFGQFCIVLEDLDAVIAINSNEEKTQDILNLVWGTLLPMLK